MSGIVGMITSFYVFNLRFSLPSWYGIKNELVDGWLVFLSISSVSFYTAGNAFILGLFATYEAVGYYSIAEKIVRAFRQLLIPVSQAVFPRFSNLASTAQNRDIVLMWGKRMLVFMGGIGLLISIGLFLGAPLIVDLLLGAEYQPSILVIRILALLPFLISISNVLGIQILLPFRKDRIFTVIVMCAGIINIALAVLLVRNWQEAGMAVAVLISEIFVTVAMLIYLLKSDLNLFSRKL